MTECEINGCEGKMYLSAVYGGLSTEVIFKLGEDQYMKIAIDGKGFLSGEDLEGGLNIADYTADMLSADKKDSTRETFLGFFNDFAGAMTIG